MQSTQTTADIIGKFETYVDDVTEISSAEELDLANKIYQGVCNERPWEFLKRAGSGTAVTTGGVTSIALPSDFSAFAENNMYTDDSYEINNNSSPRVIFMGSALTPYKIINYSDRRQYLNQIGYAYLDLSVPASKKIVFTATPTTDTLAYEYDYICNPPDLTLGTAPIFPAKFWDIIYHGMAADDQIIQIFDKARSYMKENEAKFDKYMKLMAYWNSQLINY